MKIDPTFELAVTPCSNESASFSAPRNPGNRSDRFRVVIKDASPGNYHVRLLDASGSAELAGNFLRDGDVTVKPGAEPARVILDAASIQGTVEGSQYGEIIAIDQKSKQRPRRRSLGFHGRGVHDPLCPPGNLLSRRA